MATFSGSTNSSSDSNFLDKISIKRALLSVSDKAGLRGLTEFLHGMGVELIGTTSTAKEIESYGLPVKSVDALTGFPEILGGRVKTLHPAVFGGILARKSVENDALELERHHIAQIDLVVCNLYPFQDTLARTEDVGQLVENIDIGGVTLLRAAAKNFARVGILCDPADYAIFEKSIQKNGGQFAGQLRVELALKALSETAAYDDVISSSLKHKLRAVCTHSLATGPIEARMVRSIETLPENMTIDFQRIQNLRYGENPHQKAAFYSISSGTGLTTETCSLANMVCMHGKELSYNNVLDVEHGVRLVNEFKTPASVIVKHNIPCGVGRSETSILEAYGRAFEGDTVSPFGGVVCLNARVDSAAAKRLSEIFLEVVVAPDFTQDALDILQRKKNLRLVKLDTSKPLANRVQFIHVQGGMLMQDADTTVFDTGSLSYPTENHPAPALHESILFAYTVVKHVRSNAIVITNNNQTIAVAGGFTNRVDAVDYCLRKAKLSLKGAVLASDAFFPFPDSIEMLKGTGIAAIVQPGGSVQDAEVINACERLGIAMVFTGKRHFKH